MPLTPEQRLEVRNLAEGFEVLDLPAREAIARELILLRSLHSAVRKSARRQHAIVQHILEELRPGRLVPEPESDLVADPDLELMYASPRPPRKR